MDYYHKAKGDSVINQLEQVSMSATSDSDKANDALIASFTPAEQKRIIRRVDIRLLLTTSALYCISLVDRTSFKPSHSSLRSLTLTGGNIGVALIGGMDYDLELYVGDRLNIVLLVFFTTYIVVQPLATILLRKIGPQALLPTIGLLWGVMIICMGFVKTWTQLIPLRLLLGIFEAGFFPGCAYLLSCWYTRFELHTRNAIFYLTASLLSAFSGIIAYGFLQLNGRGAGAGLGQKYGPTPEHPHAPAGQESGIAGWRWIFIMEGILTCLISLVAYYTIVDFPERAYRKTWGMGFLTREEADFMVARIQHDRHDAIPEKFNLKAYLSNALDLKVWGFAAMFGLTTTLTYSIAFFMPLILSNDMGFDLALSEILMAPPYFVAAIYTYALAYYGDKHRLRSPVIVTNGLLAILGIGLMGFVDNVGVRYFGTVLVTSESPSLSIPFQIGRLTIPPVSSIGLVPTVMTFQANNIRGQYKRAFCSATMVGAGGVGGIIGSLVYRAQDAPDYRPGMYATMTAGALVVVIALLLDVKFMRANRRADQGGKLIEGLEGFRYTL